MTSLLDDVRHRIKERVPSAEILRFVGEQRYQTIDEVISIISLMKDASAPKIIGELGFSLVTRNNLHDQFISEAREQQVDPLSYALGEITPHLYDNEESRMLFASPLLSKSTRERAEYASLRTAGVLKNYPLEDSLQKAKENGIVRNAEEGHWFVHAFNGNPSSYKEKNCANFLTSRFPVEQVFAHYTHQMWYDLEEMMGAHGVIREFASAIPVFKSKGLQPKDAVLGLLNSNLTGHESWAILLAMGYYMDQIQAGFSEAIRAYKIEHAQPTKPFWER